MASPLAVATAGLGAATKGMSKKKNKKKDGGGVRSQLRTAAEGGISKSELLSITESTGKSMAQVVKQLDKLNENLKNQGQEGVSLNSGAANQIIKQLGVGIGKATPQMFGYQQPDFGGGKIGQTIQSMLGTPAYNAQRNVNDSAIPGIGSKPAVPATLMMGGTRIKPGGRLAVQPMVAPAAIGDTTAVTAGDGTTIPTTTADAYGAGTGDAFDFQSIIDALTASQQPGFDMTGLQDMFQTEFDQLTSQFDQMKPLRLAQLGRAYGSDAIRGARRTLRKGRRDYRRAIPAMALGNAFANMAIGGGMTL